MTAKPDLLPLPKAHNLADYGDVPVRGYDNEQLQAYARANVAHATAARDAEVEALRAEVSGLRAARIAYANEFPPTEDGEPDTGNIHANIRAMKARAERLAEALRLYMSAGFGNSTDFYKQAEAKRAATEALHPTAAQENDDA